MKNFIIATLVFLVWSLLAVVLYNYIAPKTETIADISNIDIDKKELSNSFKNQVSTSVDTLTTDDSDVISEIKTGLLITDSNDQPIKRYEKGIIAMLNQTTIEVPQELDNLPNTLFNYLENNPNVELHIIAKFNPIENVQIPNLAKQRAEVFKNELIEIGIPEELIVIKSILDTSPLTETNKLQNAFDFSFQPLDEERISKLEPILPPSEVYYFNRLNNQLIVDEQLKNVLAEIRVVLSENPNSIVSIIGHSDNIETNLSSYKKALESARQVKWFLTVKGGLDRTRIQAISKGKNEPIASNRTPSGRKKNNRIEIVYTLNNQQ